MPARQGNIFDILAYTRGYVDLEYRGMFYRLKGELVTPSLLAWESGIVRFSEDYQEIKLTAPQQREIVEAVVAYHHNPSQQITFIDDNMNVLCTTSL